ncbi:MAG: phospholipase D-like domain-containing protein [Candidatus Eremiobacteraeota bacterium]|nr:phospholipase D-like domain-containing protein [Candidatus Eremiobacteraeota bacterium]
MSETAEHSAMPAYKWIEEPRKVQNIHGMELWHFNGGIGFRVRNYGPSKSLVIRLSLYREDNTIEYYLMRAYFVEPWGQEHEKWQTHQLVLFPYESLHGAVNIVTFSYLLHKDGRAIPSEYEYKFARREDFFRAYVEQGDFHEEHFKRRSSYYVEDISSHALQNALHSIRTERQNVPMKPFFTRGDPGAPGHPAGEIHAMLDRVLEAKHRDPHGRHYVHLAIFNFENEHIANHLLHLHSQGVEVECLGGWEQVSSADWSWDVARLRRGGIPVYGVVRNTPYSPHEGIASMHTKIMLFDGQAVMSASYNLDFHRWGGNWENGIFYYSPPVSLLYEHVYQAVKGAVVKNLAITLNDWYNLYYTLGVSHVHDGTLISPCDALAHEIYRAQTSIFIAMFDLGDFTLKGPHSRGVNLVEALTEAHRRGVYLVILLNGYRAEQELPLPEDGESVRPLKPVIQHLLEQGIEVLLLYYQDSPYSPLHHKFAVFDEETVIAESTNWYSASLYSDEVFSVIRDGNLAREYIGELFLMLKKFRIRRGSEVWV